MASSAKFLEEALSTDVDESAVSAIVGSLQSQLGTPSSSVSCQQVSSTAAVAANPNHLHNSISNGSPSSNHHGTTANNQTTDMNSVLKSSSSSSSSAEQQPQPQPNKSIVVSSNHQIAAGNITQTISNSSNVQGVVSTSGFINQIPSGNVAIVQANDLNIGGGAAAGKATTQDALKTTAAVYASSPSNGSRIVTTHPVQNVGTAAATALPNGNLNLTAAAISSAAAVATTVANNVLNASTVANLQGMVSQTTNSYHKITPVVSEQQNKPASTAAVLIKSTTCNNIVQSAIPPQMTTAISLSGSPLNTAVTFAKSGMGGAPTIISNAPQTIQLVNLNTIRAAAPAQAGAKTTVAPRLMLPQVVRAGPGQTQVRFFRGFLLLIRVPVLISACFLPAANHLTNLTRLTKCSRRSSPSEDREWTISVVASRSATSARYNGCPE